MILPLNAYSTIKRYGEKVISNGLVITKLVPASLVNFEASWYRWSSIALCENLGQEQPKKRMLSLEDRNPNRWEKMHISIN